jgi:hypothetical protein
MIDNTKYGYITISGKRYEYDVVIRLDGRVEKRKKETLKEKYGTSHKISIEEARHIYQDGAQELIIGTGQVGYVELSDEANHFSTNRNARKADANAAGCKSLECP